MKKKIIYIISTVVSTVCVLSCSSEIKTYNGESGIYFAMRSASSPVNADTAYVETSSVAFIVEPEEVKELTLPLRVKILGAVSEQDREFSVRVVEEETDLLAEDCTGVNGTYTLKAGEVYGTIPLTFNRTASLKGKERKITLELLENEDFSLPIKVWKNSSSEFANVVRHTVFISDKYVMLPGYYTSYFGPFSERKMEVLVEEAKIVTLDELKEKMSYVKAKSLGQAFDRYLKQKKNEGKTVYEADGKTEMTAGEYIYK